MKIKYRKIRSDTKRASKLWLEWYAKYIANPELKVSELAKQYINPRTGKCYTPQNIYFAFKRLEQITED